MEQIVEVPVEGLSEPQATCAARNIADGDDFLEADDLYCRHNHEDKDVTGEHAAEKDAHHDECPDSPGDERLLLLLVLRKHFRFRWLFHQCYYQLTTSLPSPALQAYLVVICPASFIARASIDLRLLLQRGQLVCVSIRRPCWTAVATVR